MLDLGALALLLEQLEVARGALERREPARAASASLSSAPPVDGGDSRGRADDAAEEEGPKAAALVAVHPLILRSRVCSSAPSGT